MGRCYKLLEKARRNHMGLLNLQPRRGRARAYRVRQLLAEIEGILSKEPHHESR